MSRKRSGLGKSPPLVGVLVLIFPLLLVFATPASAATVSVCTAGPPTCDYASISAAVTGETYPVTINVYPGSYSESVDLYKASGGDVTIRSVNASGTPTPGTATVSAVPSVFRNSSIHAGDITIDGLIVSNSLGSAIDLLVNGDIVIRNVTASSVDEHGIYLVVGGSVTISDCTASSSNVHGIYVRRAGGSVTISDCTASSSNGSGIIVAYTDGDVTISGCTANGNGVDNIWVYFVDGNVTITGCTANDSANGGGIWVQYVGPGYQSSGASLRAGEAAGGELDDGEQDAGVLHQSVSPSANPRNVTIENCTARDNLQEGVVVWSVQGDVTVSNCTAERNGDRGFTFGSLSGDLSVHNSVARNNTDTGVHLLRLNPSKDLEVRGSIICGNGELGLDLAAVSVTLDARGNWWGCAKGPWNPGCDSTASGIGSTLLVDPVIDSISGSATVPAVEGEPTLVTFQFSGGPPAVYLGQGPGDLHGDPRFLVGTDNGTVASSGFISDSQGRLEVTLTPAHTGTATVYVDGPCDLDHRIVVGVESEFVPEPGTVLLLGSGLMGLAGYAGLQLRKQ